MAKAQSTLLIILGLVILVSLGIFLVYLNASKQKTIISQDNPLSLEQQANQIQSYVEECMSQISVPEIYIIGQKGGYFDNAPYFGELGQSKIAYWYKDGEDISPGLGTIETNLANDLHDKFYSNCTKFETLESLKGVTINKPAYEESITKVNISINDKDIQIDFFYPMTIQISGTKKELDKFTIKQPVPLGADYNLAKKILEKAKNTTDYYSLSADCGYFSQIAQQTNVYYANNIILLNDFTTFFDKKFGDAFQFRFMVSGLKVSGQCTG